MHLFYEKIDNREKNRKEKKGKQNIIMKKAAPSFMLKIICRMDFDYNTTTRADSES